MTDEALLAAWRAGDRGAGDELLGRHFDSVLRFFRSKLGDDVEDLLQRTFLDCVEGKAQIAGSGFRGYLFAVARNRLFDHLRSKYRRPGVVDIGEISVADLGTTPSGHVARDQRRALVQRALTLISVDHQIALELTYWEGLAGAEIATVLNISEHTVRSRLARAREALREALASLTSTAEADAMLVDFGGA